jgi:hypothetical protein
MSASFLTFSLLVLGCSVSASAKIEENSSRSSREIVLPFHLSKDGYPLINGAVDGKAGVFLVDTGASDRFLLNRNYVALDQGGQAGGGSFASGQAVALRRHSGQHTADLSGVLKVAASSGDSDAPGAALSIDARRQQENIDPSFLGWLGWGFLREYVTTIDYRSRLIRLLPAATAPPVTRDRESLVIAFSPSSPTIPFTAKVGGYATPAILDTAGWDRLTLKPANWAKVTASNVISSRPGADCIAIKSANIGGKTIDLVDFERSEQTEDRLTLGIGFLQAFTAVWDPRDGKVTLTPNGVKARTRGDCS